MAQEQPGPPPTPSINIDFSGFVEGIVNGIREVLTGWANQLPEQVQPYIVQGISSVWDDFWHSGANILATPFELTNGFPPAIRLGADLDHVIPGITALAVALLGFRILWRIMQGKSGNVQEDLFSSVLLGVVLSGVSVTILIAGFSLARVAADSFGRFNYLPSMGSQAAMHNFVFWVITLVLMMFYGWRLFVRGAYRIVLLMFLAPFAPVAGILVAIPQVRWVAMLYWVTMGGWLAGGALALGALSLGLQLATIGNTNPLVSLIFGVALMQLAHDLMAWLPRSFTGSGFNGSPSWSDAGGAFRIPAVGAVMAGAAAAPAAAATVAGALPAAGDTGGYGY